MKYGFICEIIREKLASKKTAYYVCLRIEQSLRKQRIRPMKQTNSTRNFTSALFQNHKSVFIGLLDV